MGKKESVQEYFHASSWNNALMYPDPKYKIRPRLTQLDYARVAKRARGGGGNSSSSSNSSSISSRNHYETDRPPSTSRRRAWISNGQSPADPQTVQSPGIF